MFAENFKIMLLPVLLNYSCCQWDNAIHPVTALTSGIFWDTDTVTIYLRCTIGVANTNSIPVAFQECCREFLGMFPRISRMMRYVVMHAINHAASETDIIHPSDSPSHLTSCLLRYTYYGSSSPTYYWSLLCSFFDIDSMKFIVFRGLVLGHWEFLGMFLRISIMMQLSGIA